ncbi:hypothetical protein AB9F45_36155, partial [Rhizobium leguminosarum]
VDHALSGGRETTVRIAIFRMRHDDPIGHKVEGGRHNAPLLIQRRDLEEIGRLKAIGFEGSLVTHGLSASEEAGAASFLKSSLGGEAAGAGT